MKNERENRFKINKKLTLMIKIDSSLSHGNICYHLKLSKPIERRNFFKNLSQKPKGVLTLCNDFDESFPACHRWL